MPTTTINGFTLQYDVIGGGEPILLTPGGRGGMAQMRPLAEQLASAGYRAIIWDRRNCGASDVVIDGGVSEQEHNADEAFELLTRLDATPAYACAGTSGMRAMALRGRGVERHGVAIDVDPGASLLLAIRHPQAVKGVLLTAVTGWPVGAQYLAENYYTCYVEAAQRGGMRAVIEQLAPNQAPDEEPFWAARIRENPRNEQRVLSMDPQHFIRVMESWSAFTLRESYICGVTKEQLAAIRVPTLAIGGGDDEHPTYVAERVTDVVPGAEFHPPVITALERLRLANRDFRDDAAPAVERMEELRSERTLAILLQFLARVGSGAAKPPGGQPAVADVAYQW
ncbi:MAG: alpha/beta hydrolase [Dehalococcoidia bacterium]|nr:alpha/beta hydrolase [Dehalococcoidia bacterium]